MANALLLDNAAKYVEATGTIAPADLIKPESPISLDELDKAVSGAMARFQKGDPAQDAFLAPLVHKALPVSRQVAADGRLWSWLAIEHRPDYVLHRWGSKGRPDGARFVGSLTRNTFARLWWITELTVDTKDSNPFRWTTVAFSSQEFTVALFDRSFMRYRPAMEAILDGLNGKTGDVAQKVGRQLNATLGSLVLEALDRRQIRELVDQLVQDIAA